MKNMSMKTMAVFAGMGIMAYMFMKKNPEIMNNIRDSIMDKADDIEDKMCCQ